MNEHGLPMKKIDVVNTSSIATSIFINVVMNQVFNHSIRFAMTTLIERLGWRSVAALTADGEKYTDYMASLQV